MKARELSTLMLFIFPHVITWGFIFKNEFMMYSGAAFTLLGVGWSFYLSAYQKSQS